MTRTAAGFLIAGSLVFGLGAQLGVPGVFLTPDAETRFKLLERRMSHWRVAQPLYAGGPLLASIAVGLLGASSPGDTSGVLFLLAALVMLVGNVAWSYDCLMRGLHPRRFAFGNLPGWPFRVYVLTTIAGLGVFAGGLYSDGYSAWLFGAVAAADIFFLGFYAVTKDIPPFFFCLLLLAVGLVVAVDPGA